MKFLFVVCLTFRLSTFVAGKFHVSPQWQQCADSPFYTASVTTANKTATSAAPIAQSSNSISPETAAVLVAIIVPVVVIAIILLCFFQIQKHWKMRQIQENAAARVDARDRTINQSENMHLYLQKKAELSVEQQGYDVQRGERMLGSTDHTESQEMPGEDIRRPMLSLGERHELYGGEHARELDISHSQWNPHGYNFDEPHFTDFNESVLTLHDFA